MSCRFCNDIGTAEFMFPGFVYILIGSVRKQAQFILVALRGIKLQNLPFFCNRLHSCDYDASMSSLSNLSQFCICFFRLIKQGLVSFAQENYRRKYDNLYKS